MARNHSVFIAVLLGLSGLSSIATAQTCEGDFDCAVGSWCVWAGGGATVDPVPPDMGTSGDALAPVCQDPDCPPVVEPDPDPKPTTGTCEPLPKGYCVDQSDCSTGLTCIIPPSWGGNCTEPAPAPTDGGVAPAATKQSDCTATEMPAPYGYCQLPETVCTTDAECLAGLKCVEASDGGSSSGGSPGTEPSSGGGTDPTAVDAGAATEATPRAQLQSTCQVSYADCSADANSCGAGYECVEEPTVCSVDAVPATTDPASTGDDTTVQKQSDTTCEYESTCRPKFMACNTDTECASLGDWVCYSFVEGQARSSSEWPDTGVTKGCLPRGLALVAEAEGVFASGGKGETNDSGTATGAPEAANDGASTPMAPQGDGKGSSCAVGFGPRAEGAAWLVMALAFISRRRTQQA